MCKNVELTEKFNMLFENYPDVIILANISNGSIIKINSTVKDILGYSPVDLEGLDLKKIMVNPLDFSNPAALMESKELSEQFFLKKDGSIFKTGVFIAPQNWGDKLALMIIVYNRSAKLVSQDNSIYKKLYNIISETTNDGLILLDSANLIVRANVAANVLLGKDNITGKPVSSLLTGFAAPEKFLELITHTDSTPFNLKLNNGKTINGYTYPITEADKNIEKMIVLRDITRQMEFEKLQNDFVSTIIHDLRTPLTSILGFAGTIIRDIGPTEDPNKNRIADGTRKEYLQIIQNESKRLAQLVDELANYSEKRQQTKFSFSKLNIKKIISEVLVIFSQKDCEKEISTDFPEEDIICFGDSEAIKQMFINLISNSLKFTLPQGKIIIKIKQNAANVVLTVSDNGLGIPKEDLPFVFDRFFRVYRPGNEVAGVGLGLSTVKEIVAAHKGKILVESTPMVNTKFVIELPKSL